MRVVDLVAQFLIQLRNFPEAQGYVDDSDGNRYYISPANPQRHVHPVPTANAKVRKAVITL